MAGQENCQEPAFDRLQTGGPGFVRDVLKSFFGQNLLNSALLVGMAVALTNAAFLPKEFVEDPDLWWHLADARILTTMHHFIRIEPYSFALVGQRWVNPEWLAEVPYWLGYSFLGLRGIHVVALAGLCANLLLIYFRSAWKSHHKKVALLTSALAFFLIVVNGGARTIAFGYLAMSGEMAIIEAAERGRRFLLWLLPPLFCLWINLHGSWVIGLGFFGLFIVCGLFQIQVGAFQQCAFSSVERNRLIGVLVASAAALLVNPYGWRLVWNPFDMLVNQRLMLALTEEWRPLSLGSSTGVAAAVAIALMIAANLVRGRSWKLYEIAFIFAAWYYAFAHQRFAYLAAVITMPLFAVCVAESFFGEADGKTIPALNALFAAAILCALIYFFPPEEKLRNNLADSIPLRTIASIQPSWHTLSDYSLGGMLAFQAKADFVDSRNDTFEHHGILQQFLAIESLRNPYALLDKNQIDHVLTRTVDPLAFALSRSQGWRVVAGEGTGDNAYVLFARIPGVPAD